MIEHLPRPERFVAEARRVLKPDGVLVVSTPRAEEGHERPDNPFHEREFSRGEFEQLLRGSFGSVERLRAAPAPDAPGTARSSGSTCSAFAAGCRSCGARRGSSRAPRRWTPSRSEGVVISRDGVDEATELVAVCRP